MGDIQKKKDRHIFPSGGTEGMLRITFHRSVPVFSYSMDNYLEQVFQWRSWRLLWTCMDLFDPQRHVSLVTCVPKQIASLKNQISFSSSFYFKLQLYTFCYIIYTLTWVSCLH